MAGMASDGRAGQVVAGAVQVPALLVWQPPVSLCTAKPLAASPGLYPPCASLKMFFLRSMICSVPRPTSLAMSPVWKKPSSSAHTQAAHVQHTLPSCRWRHAH